jgi:hypothetical protein
LVGLTSVCLNLLQLRISYRIIISEEKLRIDIKEYIAVNRIDWLPLSVEVSSTFVRSSTNKKVENPVHLKVNF